VATSMEVTDLWDVVPTEKHYSESNHVVSAGICHSLLDWKPLSSDDVFL
jgi:hypothetical protein